MGQCPHTFHVMCLVKACLVCSVCSECCTPLSPRLYKILGLLESMATNTIDGIFHLTKDPTISKIISTKENLYRGIQLYECIDCTSFLSNC